VEVLEPSCLKPQSKLYYDRRSVCLDVSHSFGTLEQFLSVLELFLDSYAFVDEEQGHICIAHNASSYLTANIFGDYQPINAV
jgi:hypothetical protein